MLGKSAMKWRQRPDMAIAVDWDVKHQFKKIIDQNLKFQDSSHLQLLCKLVSIGPDLRTGFLMSCLILVCQGKSFSFLLSGFYFLEQNRLFIDLHFYESAR